MTPTSLESAIEGLLLALAGTARQANNPQASADPRQSVWEDDEYRYIEFSIESPDVPFCDISIMEGKAFIRIAREVDDAEPIEGLPRLATIVPIAAPLES